MSYHPLPYNTGNVRLLVNVKFDFHLISTLLPAYSPPPYHTCNNVRLYHPARRAIGWRVQRTAPSTGEERSSGGQEACATEAVAIGGDA